MTAPAAITPSFDTLCISVSRGAPIATLDQRAPELRSNTPGRRPMVKWTLLAGAAAFGLGLASAAEARTLGFIVSNFTHASYDGAEDCPAGLNTDARTFYVQ